MLARNTSIAVRAAIFFVAAEISSPVSAAPPITIESLLEEMIDRSAVARLPNPWYVCAQASSYDRKSTSPDDAEGWFANGDASQYIRVEENGGRREWVMMEADGPGAIVRLWSANPKGTLRIYLDGESQPALEAPMEALLGGTWSPGSEPLGAPLAAVRSRGWNLYLPIPYARHCKITSDSDGFYYQVNYRTYDGSAAVTSFSTAALLAAADVIDRVQGALAAPAGPPVGRTQQARRTLGPGERFGLALPPGPSAVRTLTCRIAAADYSDALRTVVLSAEFDQEKAIWCPVGDFYGVGIGLNRFEDWYRSAAADERDDSIAVLTSRWVMPYRKSGSIVVENLGVSEATIELVIENQSWQWDDRSMHFHAHWRHENPIPTRPMQDWNYIDIKGQGVYVGDSLAVVNPVEAWWGEGDEKIYVDGEAFPSHFGTGTEDYYGYAWCCPETFTGPFHAQPRCDGPGNYGHTAVSRVRLLDAIPFRTSLRMDMEVWHWQECNAGYAAATFFYARPGAVHNRDPQPDEARRGPLHPAPLPPPFTIEGAVECEDLVAVRHSADLQFGPQGMKGFARHTWSGDEHLWVRAVKVGDFIELVIPTDAAGPVDLTLHATKSWDYGIVQFSVNGRAVGEPFDFFSGAQGVCQASGPIELGSFRPDRGRLILRAEVVGGNPQASGDRAFFGLDCVVLTPSR